MSYEREIFTALQLPSREGVVKALLSALLANRGVVKEFGSGAQEVADEIADRLSLNNEQRTHKMETIVRKEGRLKTFPAWNRLLFRSADYAAKLGLVTRPTLTIRLTGKREWMLTEKGIDAALRLSGKHLRKEDLPVSTYEVERVKKEIVQAKRPLEYLPIDLKKKKRTVTRNTVLRYRGFRLAVIDSYQHRCCVCGLLLPSPDFLSWEVEAAHIVPHRYLGKDDIWNGIALCHFHHWAFDAGWFTLNENFTIQTSRIAPRLSREQGRMKKFDLFTITLPTGGKINLPESRELYPHEKSLQWHRTNVFVDK